MQWTWIVILVSVIIIVIGLILLWVQGIDSQIGVTVTVLGLLVALIGLSAIIFGYWQPSKSTIEASCNTCDTYRQKKFIEDQISRSAAQTALGEQAKACKQVRVAQAEVSRPITVPVVPTGPVPTVSVPVPSDGTVQTIRVRAPAPPIAYAAVPRSAEIFNLPAAKSLL